MSLLNALILGLIQGVAEFLPISSSGHLSIAQNLLGLKVAGSDDIFFDVLLHLGTLAAVFAAYWEDIREMILEFFRTISDLAGRRTVDGVSVLGAEYLMLFKMKAWLDLRQKKADSAHVNERDLKKHKNDVFRLFRLVEPSAQIAISSTVGKDVGQFINAMRSEPINLEKLDVEGMPLDEVLRELERMFVVS